MASDDRAVSADRDGRSPLPSDLEESRLRFGDYHTVSGEVAREAGLVFVTSKESKNAMPESTQEGVVTLSSLSDPKLEELWKKAESVMAARQLNVREVMEDFGVADVPPATDELEEQLWQVVEGDFTLQEAADLV